MLQGMRGRRCCGCCRSSPSAHPCPEAQHLSGCPPPALFLSFGQAVGCHPGWIQHAGTSIPVWCMPTLGISCTSTGAMEGGKDPAALQLCSLHCWPSTEVPGQPQADVLPRPPSTKRMLLLFFSPSPNRAKHGSSGAGKMEAFSPSSAPRDAPTTSFPLLATHLPFGRKKKKKKIIKFLFPPHLPFPGLSKECHKSDKLKATDYCGFMAFILLVKRANIRNNVVRPASEPNPAINQHSCAEGARASDMQRGSN